MTPNYNAKDLERTARSAARRALEEARAERGRARDRLSSYYAETDAKAIREDRQKARKEKGK